MTLPWASLLQALVEGEVPAVAEANHLQHAAVGEIAANLLGQPHPHMLGDLLGAPDMRRDLGDGLEDEMQVPDRDAFGQQDLQDREQSRKDICDGQRSSTSRLYSGSSRSSSPRMSL